MKILYLSLLLISIETIDRAWATNQLTVVSGGHCATGTCEVCEGDCDDDDDCEGNLVCFHRDAGQYEVVPGCTGGTTDGSRTDYCVDPGPTLSVVAGGHCAAGGCEACEGDCDGDDDCEGRLLCFHRNAGGYENVPGCSGGAADGSRTDYCYDPCPNSDELCVIGNNGSPLKTYPLLECQGDCDDDDDCDGNLECFHRDAGDYNDVPGCSGGDADGSRTDYCYEVRRLRKRD